MKKQGMGGSAFFVGVGWLGLPAGAVDLKQKDTLAAEKDFGKAIEIDRC